MFKSTIKLLSLLLLLIFSFIYTDKVFDEARKNDPIMKQVINYKKKNDKNVIEPTIKDDEIILGMSGLVVDEELSYKKMKSEDSFSKKNIVYKKSYLIILLQKIISIILPKEIVTVRGFL